MKVYDKKLMARRDTITEFLRSLGMRCFAQIDMTKPSNGATLFLECWTDNSPKVVLLMVDKFGGICTYRPLTAENSMDAERDALREYIGYSMETVPPED